MISRLSGIEDNFIWRDIETAIFSLLIMQIALNLFLLNRELKPKINTLCSFENILAKQREDKVILITHNRSNPTVNDFSDNRFYLGVPSNYQLFFSKRFSILSLEGQIFTKSTQHAELSHKICTYTLSRAFKCAYRREEE